MKSGSVQKLILDNKNLERILDNLKDGIIAHDLKRKIFFMNKVAERITGFHRGEVLGRDCHDVFGAPLCGDHCSFCGNHCQLPMFKEYPITVVPKDGGPRQLEVTVTGICDEKDQIVGVVAAFRDITEVVHLKTRAGSVSQFSNIVGSDRKMLQVFQQIEDVAAYDFPVHISGETGTGKELVAAAIHNESRRSKMSFVPINCGALPEGLIESELFGHVRGAFTGAVRDKKGRFELAAGGTIFLDEVAELSKFMQVKLLRFLQEGAFEKVGDEKTLHIDTRVISATNKSLRKAVETDQFREDLFYRLNVIPIHIPPLRERKNDIPLLVAHFVQMNPSKTGRPVRVSREALSLMMDYSWPGNVRELQNAIQFAIVKCSGHLIRVDDLPLEIRRRAPDALKRGPIRKLDVAKVRAALRKTNGNKVQCAKLLGVGRATLYRFLNDYPHTLDGLE